MHAARRNALAALAQSCAESLRGRALASLRGHALESLDRAAAEVVGTIRNRWGINSRCDFLSELVVGVCPEELDS